MSIVGGGGDGVSALGGGEGAQCGAVAPARESLPRGLH